METVTVNMSNNFGPNQHPEKLVPRTIISILRGEPVVVHGKGDHVRDWLFVKKAAHGIWLAGQKGGAGESYCLGGDTELKNMEMICLLYEAIQQKQSVPPLQLNHTDDRPTDDMRYALDSTKAVRDLKWRAGSENFRNYLALTVEWYIHAMLHDGGGALHGRGA
jgi:dTDP-glucose 4,6-dehydratase